MNFAQIFKLIFELKKDGREFLYDKMQRDYKNNTKKQREWEKVGQALGITKIECQVLWKNVKKKYNLALEKDKGRSGSETCFLKAEYKYLLKEMDFFRNFVRSNEPTVSSYASKPTERNMPLQNLFDEMAEDPDVQEVVPLDVKQSKPKKRTSIEEAEKSFEDSCRKLEEYSKMIQDQTERDPFFLSLEQEFGKVPAHRRNDLKISLLTEILNAQK